MNSMQAQSEIDVTVWPFVEDFDRAVRYHSTTLEDGERRVQVVALDAVREQYHNWRAQYEQLLTLNDELAFEHDQLQIQLTATMQAPSNREAALEAEIVSLKADLAAKVSTSSNAEPAKWQREYEKQGDMAVKWRKRYDTVNELALKIPSYQAASPQALQPQPIIIQAPSR
ncbi:hypothetical protein FN846DRAFT_893580 [Sphaerosporella brunnea]|uniref:Uncharacterized protein n=1 Tax=Sphaerosporella brunnea TaxID=1250544 RepID=A0A5J5EM10_9PEZI|nr:hypothetical protein FN846DRAFT_893580 [Sphaerosporella brunnea]